MPSLSFDARRFSRTLVIFVILSATWTLMAHISNDFTDRDKGFVTGLGFLIVLALTIALGNLHQAFRYFFVLLPGIIFIFCIASFLLLMVINAITSSEVLYAVTSSLFVSVTMTILVHKIYHIRFILLTMAGTFILLLLAYYFVFYSDIITKFESISFLFNTFNLFLLLPLTLGMTITRRPDQ